MAENRTVEHLEEEGAELVHRGGVLAARDRYVLVFTLIMVIIGLNALLGDHVVGVGLVGIGLALTLAVTVVTSDSGKAASWIAAGFGGLTLVAAVALAFLGQNALVPRFGYKIGLLGMTLVLATVIGKRIVRHPVINLNTLAGAASIYLLLGLLFGVTFSFLGGALNQFWHMGSTPAQAFFVASRPVAPSDFLYFSFITLTTVGYGDLTASTELGRMLCVVEALLGQLYLVTVVAVLVSNMGRRRGRAQNSAE